MAREAHLLLYRSMIEALRGSANLAVTARLSKDRSVRYQRGTRHWQEIHRLDMPKRGKAWRFSESATRNFKSPALLSQDSRLGLDYYMDASHQPNLTFQGCPKTQARKRSAKSLVPPSRFGCRSSCPKCSGIGATARQRCETQAGRAWCAVLPRRAPFLESPISSVRTLQPMRRL